MDSAFMKKLVSLRITFNFPMILMSAFRCPDYNAHVSSTGHTGPHTTGKAVDIKIARGLAYQLLKLALIYDFTGIGVKQHGDGRFIHLDTLTNGETSGPRPTIWSY